MRKITLTLEEETIKYLKLYANAELSSNNVSQAVRVLVKRYLIDSGIFKYYKKYIS